ncbi:MAG: type I-E CRISPR-associated protein Cas6/Cse3/CasE [Cumulibacter sp.]
MYLTHMALNPQRRSTRTLVESPQRLHAAVLSSFVPGTANQGRILWRLDSPERKRLDLYIVSPVQPSLEAMADQAGWPSQPVWRTADYSPLLERLEANQRWVFRLRANPVRSVRPQEGGRGSRVSLLRVEEQVNWLLTRSAKLGFTVVPGEHGPNVKVTEVRTEKFRRGGPESRLVTLGTAAFEGVMDVTDPQRLRQSLVLGIGSAKGYGCGLMTLARER